MDRVPAQMERYLIAVLACYFMLLVFAQEAISQSLPIEVVSWRCEQDDHSINVLGEVRNSSKQALNLVGVATFRSIGGEALKHIRGSLAFSPLPPGQTSAFELSTTYRPDIADCELGFQDTGNGMIYKMPGKYELPGDISEMAGEKGKGEYIFNGKGVCFACHGAKGYPSQIPASSAADVNKMNPKPSNFRDPAHLKLKTNKQRLRAIRYGIPRTAMVPMDHVTNEEILHLLAYLKSLQESPSGGAP